MDFKYADQQELQDKESSYGTITQIKRVIVEAEGLIGAKMHEIVRIGDKKLIGEVIKINGTKCYIQCFEDLSNVTQGECVIRTKEPLITELGPGLRGIVYDSMQRQLTEMNQIKIQVDSEQLRYLPKKKIWHFTANKNLKIGSLVGGGDVLGHVDSESEVVSDEQIILPPTAKGKLLYLASDGDYTVSELIAEVEYQDEKIQYSMCHRWPVRKPRPYIEKLSVTKPLYTGMRFYDLMYPMAQGGTCLIPDAFGTSHIEQSFLQKYSHEIFGFITCGAKGNYLSEKILNLEELQSRNNKNVAESALEKSFFIANQGDMPMGSREASIFMGLTIGEYYRDIGKNVVSRIHSTSQWAESVREIATSLGETLGESGYPPYIQSRMSEFYQRAGVVKCLGSPDREGSLSVLFGVNPLENWRDDVVVGANLKYTSTFWAIDRALARVKHFPEVNWEYSFSDHLPKLKDYYHKEYDSGYYEFRGTMLKILEKEKELSEIIKMKGKDQLSMAEELDLYVGRCIREDFLQQNLFSQYDFNCSIDRGMNMMKSICYFYEQGNDAIQQMGKEEQIKKKSEFEKLLLELDSKEMRDLKFDGHKMNKYELEDSYDKWMKKIRNEFRDLVIE